MASLANEKTPKHKRAPIVKEGEVFIGRGGYDQKMLGIVVERNITMAMMAGFGRVISNAVILRNRISGEVCSASPKRPKCENQCGERTDKAESRYDVYQV